MPRSGGGGFIVAGNNYGQDRAASTRARSGAARRARRDRQELQRIHRRNLIAQGVLPLLFKDEADYDRAQLGQTWRIAGLHGIAEGEDELEAEIVSDGGGRSPHARPPAARA